MAILPSAFNSTDIPPEAPIEALPPGDYVVCIIESLINETKNGNGQVLKLVLQVVDGGFKGRKLFDYINIQNSNIDAQRIGQSRLSSICKAVSKPIIQDTAEIHEIPMLAKVAIKNSEEYGKQNQIKGYLPYKGNPVAPPAGGYAPAKPSTPVSGPAPWD